MWVSSSLNTICWRDCSFPTEYLWHPYWKSVAIDVWVYFRTLNSISLIYMSISMPVPHCFDYCSFAVGFEIRKCGSSNFVFLFKIVLAIGGGHLQFHMTISISVSNSLKKKGWNFDRDCTGSIGQFEEFCHLNNIKSSHPWTWDVCPFLKIHFIYLFILAARDLSCGM